MNMLRKTLKRWSKQGFILLGKEGEVNPAFEAFEAASPEEKKQLLGELIGLHAAAETLLKELLLDHTSQRRLFMGDETRTRLSYNSEEFSLEEEGECLYHTLSISGADIPPSDQHVFVNWDHHPDYFSTDFPLREMWDPNWRSALTNAQLAREKATKQSEEAKKTEEVERERALLLQLHLKYPGVLRNY